MRYLTAFLASGLLAVTLALPAGAASIGSWTPTSSYPLPVANASCVANSGYAYCIGGYDINFTNYNSAYFAPFTATGVGPWKETTGYKSPIDSSSCVTDSGYDYCIGGENHTNQVNATCFSRLSSLGFGAWSCTTQYPLSPVAVSCVTYTGDVYCVGGFNGSRAVRATYYAQLSSTGIGPWASTTPYPIPVDSTSCVVDSGYVYCIGGESQGTPNGAVYFAQLSKLGMGSWSSTRGYPIAVANPSCVSITGTVSCVGGVNSTAVSQSYVYSASLSASGVGSWSPGAAYPTAVNGAACIADSSRIYCVAGASYTLAGQGYFRSVYYATPGVLSSTSTSSSVPEFPAAILPLILAASLVMVVVVLQPFLRRKTG